MEAFLIIVQFIIIVLGIVYYLNIRDLINEWGTILTKLGVKLSEDIVERKITELEKKLDNVENR